MPYIEIKITPGPVGDIRLQNQKSDQVFPHSVTLEVQICYLPAMTPNPFSE